MIEDKPKKPITCRPAPSARYLNKKNPMANANMSQQSPAATNMVLLIYLVMGWANQHNQRLKFCDPTHKSHLNSFSFRYFGENHGGFGYYSKARFREVSVRVKLLAFWRWLGFQFLVNAFPRYRRFWEHYLCYVVRGKVMEFEFEVLK